MSFDIKVGLNAKLQLDLNPGDLRDRLGSKVLVWMSDHL